MNVVATLQQSNNDKDKLIAVVTLLLVTPLSLPVESCVDKISAVRTCSYPILLFCVSTTVCQFCMTLCYSTCI